MVRDKCRLVVQCAVDTHGTGTESNEPIATVKGRLVSVKFTITSLCHPCHNLFYHLLQNKYLIVAGSPTSKTSWLLQLIINSILYSSKQNAGEDFAWY